MITNKKELRFYINEDIKPYVSSVFRIRFWAFATRSFNYYRIRFMKHFRKTEYFKNTKGFFHKLLRFYHQRKMNLIGNKLNWEIPTNVAGYGLHLGHPNIVINADSKIGNNVTFNGNNCLGRKGNTPNQNFSPKIGNNVVLGFGSVLVGDIHIANNCVIGANSVVINDFEVENSVIVGNPGRKL